MAEDTYKLADIEIVAKKEDMDEDGFVSIWNVASASTDADPERTKALASAILGFLCKKDCDFVVCSQSGLDYLDQWFEKDNKILYQWKPDSETIDVIAQHAEVPFRALKSYLSNQKFKPAANYNPTRAIRREWFANKWCIG
ncbi:MAG: hypothetical protein AAF664_03390 [Planctomycetota bacterium]